MALLLLIDGNSLINRAFYAIASLNAPDGTPTNALFGFTNMLVKMIESLKPSHIAAVFDLKAPTFRHLRYVGYKATRKGMPDDLAVQLPLLKELLGLMNIRCLEKEGYEADDIIGTLATKERIPTVIVTGDRDALQLVSHDTTVHLTKHGISEIQVITPAIFQDIYGFEPSRLVDLKALMGDPSDNIPGVPGIGEKRAMDLLHRYYSLDGVYAHLDELKGAVRLNLENNKEKAYLSYELATICTHVPIEYDLDDLKYDFPFSQAVRNKFVGYAFRTLSAKESLFQSQKERAPEAPEIEVKEIGPEELSRFDGAKNISLAMAFGSLCIATDARREYRVRFGGNLLEAGYGVEETLAGFFALSDPAVGKTVFDGKSLRRTVREYGSELKGVDFDVQLTQYVVDCTKPNDSLEAVLGVAGLTDYAAYPAAALWKLRETLLPKLEEFRQVFYEIEMPLEEILYRMEERGVLVDKDELDQAGKKLLAESQELAQEIYGYAGHPFNVNSPKQIGHVLFEEMGLSAGKKTKQKTYSTSAEVLESLRGVPIVDAILRYRIVAKLHSTYVEGIKKLLGSDRVIHTVYKQTVTSTGRLSSIEPNLQNIPVRDAEGKLLRRMFVAREGYRFVSADYSQIELRLLAHFSGEEDLIEAYRRGEDIHRTTASHVFGVAPEDVTAEMRRDAKTVNFGVIYGISDFGLAKNLGISVAKARKYILGYFMRYPKVKAYLDGEVEQARLEGKLRTPTGRVRRFDNINSSNFLIRTFNERAAMNMPLQATAADLIKIAMIRVDRALKASGMDAHLLLQVHDELIVEAAEDCVERAGALLRREMESAMEFRVPLVVDLTDGKTWFDL